MAQTQSVDGVIDQLGTWFAKAPALPKGGKDFIVNVAPWAALIVGILTVVLGALALLGTAVVSPLAAVGGVYGASGVGLAANLLIASVVLIVLGVIYILAFKPLKNRAMRGWKLMFWGEVLSLLHSAVSFDIISVVISFLIGFYILFQVRSYYK